MVVIVFDIDGTLLNTGGAGRAALDAAMRDAFGVPDPHDVPVSGRTDRGIARNLFSLHGIDDTPDHWSRFRDAYLTHLARFLPERPRRVLPGVVSLLERLARREHVATGLLTGNAGWSGSRCGRIVHGHGP